MKNDKIEYSEYLHNFKTMFQPHKRQSSTLTFLASVFGNLNFWFSWATKMQFWNLLLTAVECNEDKEGIRTQLISQKGERRKNSS